MKKFHLRRRIIIFSGAFLVGLIALIFLILWFVNAPYRSKIPALSNIKSYSAPLQQQISEANDKAHKNPTSNNLGMLGMVYQSCAEYEKAIECYQLAVKRNKSAWYWSYLLGNMYKEMGESEKAISSFTAIVKTNPKVWHAWYYLGEGLYKKGSYDEAELAFSKIPFIQPIESSTSRADMYPLQTYANYQIARIYSNKKDLDKSVSLLKDIISKSNTYGPAYRLLANIYNAKGDSSWSKYYIIRANDLSDYIAPVDTIIDRVAQISRSELYLLKQIDESVKSFNIDWTFSLLDKALINIPDNKYILSKAVKLYLKLDNPQQAIPHLNSHLKLYANDVNELKEVAGLLSDKGLYSESLKYYSRLEILKPEDSDIVSGKAMALAGINKKTEAIDEVTKLVEGKKNDINALKDAIYFLIVEGEKERAEKLLAVLKQKVPLDAKVIKYEGMLYDVQGNTLLAIDSYEKAFRLDPSDLTTIEYLGNDLLKQKMWKKALDHFRNALKFHPNDPYLLERVGTLFVTCEDTKLRNYNLAKEFSERAYNNVKSSPHIMISAGRSLGLAYYSLGDKENAYTFLNISLNLAKQANYPDENIQELERILERIR